MPRRVAIAAVGSVLLSTTLAAGQEARAGETAIPDAARMLQQMYPGARVHMDQGRVRVIYGVPMTWAGTSDDAAAQFLQFHANAFGAGPLTLRKAWSTPVQNGRFTAYAYNQDIDGMPVEHGNARILVLNGPVPRVVYAAGTLAAKPAGGWPAVTMNGLAALQMVKNMEGYGGLPVYTTPTAAVWQSNAATTKAHRAWKFQGYIPGIGGNKSLTFFVDMATGALLEARNEVLETDVSGTVRGWATPGTNPDIAGNAPVLMPMPEIQMAIQGGSNAYSERDGDFTIPNPGTSAVTVTSNLSGGRWVNVNPNGVAELSLNLPGVVPPGNINPEYNTPQPTPTNSPNTAQVNAFIHTNHIHNYYKDRAPGFAQLDVVIPANTGVAGQCNAFFTTSPVPSINFYNFGGGCNNSAYSSVIAHEYGHFVVNRLGLAQGAFGEGFSDVGAMLLYDFGIIAPNFYTSGAFIRDPGGANQQYPCAGGVHQCGMTLGGIWWETLVLFKGVYGSGPGLDKTRELQVAWAMITLGAPAAPSPPGNSAGPPTAIEVLTVDDDDGNIGNGTPNYGSICNAFSQHGINCPPLTLVQFQYPSGLPQVLTPNENTTVRVDVVPVAGTPVANSGQVSYSISGAAFQSVQMNTVGTNQYEAVIPGAPCLAPVRFYFSVATTSAGVVTDPPTAPASTFSAVSAIAITNIFTDTFETNLGWSGVAPGDNALTGRWNRMDPQATAAQPENDVTPAPGVACWVTDGNAGASIGAFDVDSGITTLTSPLLDLSSAPEAKVSYWRWYSNNQNGVIDDTFNVGISNNNGTTWTSVETLGPTGTQSVGGWLFKEFRVADFVPPTSQVRIRFVAADLGSGSIVEAAVDDFKVVEVLCEAPCYPDCDGVNGLTVADFGCFQTKFVAGDPYADCDGVNGLTVADFGCFQTKFVAGCP